MSSIAILRKRKIFIPDHYCFTLGTICVDRVDSGENTMSIRFQLLVALNILILFSNPNSLLAESSSIQWRDWNPSVFDEAKTSKKLVLLNLRAVWCHWCHVMEEQTYTDLRMTKLLSEKIIPVAVDQDARPDLSGRYRRYGWPATIIFGSDGTELAKRAGFIEADELVQLLERLHRQPIPEKSDQVLVNHDYAETALLDSSLRRELLERFFSTTDEKLGGLNVAKRTIDPDTVEYALKHSGETDARYQNIAVTTLNANLKLIDPVWGGVYQYSTHRDWDHPHFEKIMSSQATSLRLYAAAYGRFADETYLSAAHRVTGYLNSFLRSPSGAYYTSQDADAIPGKKATGYFELDDSARRKIGVPRVDTAIYARENGWAISALLGLYAVTNDEEVLEAAKKAADWIVKHHRLQGGGFRHSAQDQTGPYLGDSLAMGEAALDFYTATGDRTWLQEASTTGDFIAKAFRDDKGDVGFTTAVLQSKSPLAPVLRLDENIAMARFANLLFHYTGNQAYKLLAERALRYIGTPKIALSTLTEPGVLLAAEEFASDPLHITVVGAKDDPAAAALHAAGLRYPAFYKRLEWWDKKEGPLMHNDVDYPALPKAAAFICTERRCSLPITKPEGIAKVIAQLLDQQRIASSPKQSK